VNLKWPHPGYDVPLVPVGVPLACYEAPCRDYFCESSWLLRMGENNPAASMPLLTLSRRRGCRGRPRARGCRSCYPLVLIGRSQCASFLGRGAHVRFMPPGSHNIAVVDGTNVLRPACECCRFHDVGRFISCAGFSSHGSVRVVALDVPRVLSIGWSIVIEMVDGQNASLTSPLDWEL
jgi:hypothetical protein